MMTHYELIKILLVITFSLPTHASAGNGYLPFLSSIELMPIKGTPHSRSEIRLFHKDNRELASYLARERSYTVARKQEHISVMNRGYSFPKGTKAGTTPSFVVNFDHQIFTKLKQEIIANYGERPGAAHLI